MDQDEYQNFPSFWPDPQLRKWKWNLWGYVDVRDVAAACRLGLEADVTGSHNVIIAADTVMNRPSRGARALLGYDPAHSWRDYLQRTPPPASSR